MPGPDRKRRLTTFVVAMAVLIATPLAVVASDRFNDVPDSNIFHDDIAWLADNDVTRGCNPPDNDEFCPSDNVTRQQMAAFMRRLAENEVVNAATANEADHAATADDADTVGGQSAADLQSVVYGAACDTDCAEALKVMSIDIDFPADGVAKFDYHLSIDNNDGSQQPQFGWIAAGDTCETIVVVIIVLPSNAAPGSIVQTALPANQVGSLSGTTALSVGEGAQTFSLCQLSYSPDFNILRGSLTAVWSPADSSVAVASASDVETFSQDEIDAYTEMLES